MTKSCFLTRVLFFPAEGEKAAGEKEKDKEAPAVMEAIDAKEKSDVVDLNKGVA